MIYLILLSSPNFCSVANTKQLPPQHSPLKISPFLKCKVLFTGAGEGLVSQAPFPFSQGGSWHRGGDPGGLRASVRTCWLSLVWGWGMAVCCVGGWLHPWDRGHFPAALQLHCTPLLLPSNFWEASCFLILSRLPRAPSSLTSLPAKRGLCVWLSPMPHGGRGVVSALAEHAILCLLSCGRSHGCRTPPRPSLARAKMGKRCVCSLPVTSYYLIPSPATFGPGLWKHPEPSQRPGRAVLILPPPELPESSLH